MQNAKRKEKQTPESNRFHSQCLSMIDRRREPATLFSLSQQTTPGIFWWAISGISHSRLLGLNFLSHFIVTLDYSRMQVRLERIQTV
ncbi:MAG: hypothetical protein A3F84_13675 [Candidatus Handelsmanbacteria bacterium RIFCSPLOWO2_12_FULL_64_10]|uniref:Uncharacterized protein n=1 Tax=Handelsmanbacteria sp. (strain RIFCSPLOWO2_12_FULL_64_10) TaxID=1817868 RepID=A0A1F6CM66_HANXR|nr:MAG: hypothetical protein A3F84_13675 [Candidatus Handelsmanbacteria bacterium RIFCSPLOWO2_12_FULL_64_10]